MSDPTTEEESLISQDDIDKLLDSSSIEEAEEKLSSEAVEENGDVDELGELSQDDIDSLMNSNTLDEEDAAGSDDAGDELGELSQDDIDSLMNSNTSDDESDDDALEDDDDDMELISQDDIDQLMNSGSSSDDSDTESLTTEDDSADDIGELSQDDIDAMMNASAGEDDPDEDEAFEFSQDDVNSLMKKAAENADVEKETEPSVDESEQQTSSGEEEGEEQPEEAVETTPEIQEEPAGETTQDVQEDEVKEDGEAPALNVDIDEDDYVIEESEAVDVQECLVTQETIDDLIQNFGNEPEEPVVPEETPEEEPVILDEAAESTEETKTEEEGSPNDSDDFLEPNSDVTVLDFDEDDEDVTQEDIDALLLNSDDDEDEEDDILISQDDIDTLLMAADDDDEDVLGDIMEDDDDAGMDTDIDDEDILDDEDYDDDDEDEEDYDDDQVVLEGDDEASIDKPGKKIKEKAGARWYKSKLVIACASALIVLGITVPLTYFIFFSGEPGEEELPGRQTPSRLMVDAQREIEIETVDIQIKKPIDNKKPGNMVLKDFIILASEVSKEMAYITTDISIDYSDQRAYHEIQNNMSFYRDLIYDSIHKSLLSEKGGDMTEADIIWIVETTLKKVLPGHYINRVSFKSFKAS